MRNILLLFSLVISLGGCTDSPFDKRGYKHNEQKFKNEADSLNKLYEGEIDFYAQEYQFKNLKNSDTLPEIVKDKYDLWKDLQYAIDDQIARVNKAKAIDEANTLSSWSIVIGFITLRLLVFRKKIFNKWLKFTFYSGITFLLWLGTSCYAFLFMKYPTWTHPQSDIAFFTLSTQFKLLPFMVLWLAQTIFIGLIVISIHRLFVHLFSVIDLEIYTPGYSSSGKINLDRDLTKQFQLRLKKYKLKDDRLKNLLLYVCSSFVLVFLYCQNDLVTKIEFVRNVIAIKSISDYWYLLLIAVVFVVYYFREGSLLNGTEKLFEETEDNV
jgi:hypothetical protein